MTELPPPADLAHLVAGCWLLAGGPVPRALPRPAVDLLSMPDGTTWLAGPETRARQGRLPPGGTLVGLRLRPGVATTLFDRPADEVPLAGVPLEVGSVGGPARQRLAGALRLVRARADRYREDPRVAAVLAAVHAAPGVPVARHAAAVGLSERQLRRRFGVAVGLAPKPYARVVRLHHALGSARAAEARGERPQWADIAVASGYYDQPHLLSEFRAAVGVPPGELVAGSSKRGRGTADTLG